MIKIRAKKKNRSFNNELTKAYQLNYLPIGIKFIKKGESTFGIPKTRHKKTVCAFIKLAAQGASFFLDKDSISCPGGLKWMGFPSKLTETYFYKFFLGEVEKVKATPEIAEKFIDFLPETPEEGEYEKILFAPLNHCQFNSDVVVIITHPKQAYRFVISAYLDEYHLVKTIPICSACHGVITIPLMTGEINLSMIDPMAREFGKYEDGEVLIGVPYPRLEALIDNLKKTPFGSRKETLFVKMMAGIIKRLSS